MLFYPHMNLRIFTAINMFNDLFTLPDFMLFDNNRDIRLNFNSKVSLNNSKEKTYHKTSLGSPISLHSGSHNQFLIS